MGGVKLTKNFIYIHSWIASVIGSAAFVVRTRVQSRRDDTLLTGGVAKRNLRKAGRVCSAVDVSATPAAASALVTHPSASAAVLLSSARRSVFLSSCLRVVLTYLNTSFRYLNAVFTYLNSLFTYLNITFTYLNVIFTYLNVVFTSLNVLLTYLNASFTSLNVAFTYLNVSFTYLNASFCEANVKYFNKITIFLQKYRVNIQILTSLCDNLVIRWLRACGGLSFYAYTVHGLCALGYDCFIYSLFNKFRL
jgi:hypothetical protein